MMIREAYLKLGLVQIKLMLFILSNKLNNTLVFILLK